MTDKQKIIDDVDVSGCEYYFDEKCRCMDASIMQDFYSCPQCNSTPNCYYKQLKRKEQECERLKKEKAEILERTGMIETLQDFTVKELEYMRRRQAQLKAENEELKDELQKYKDNEQQEKDIKKLYNKFEGSSLIDYKNKRM